MKKIDVITTQNVRIEYELAGLGARLFAFLLDQIVIWMGIFILQLVLLFFISTQYSSPEEWLYIMLFAPVYIFYTPAMEILNNGQTVGKMALRIKVLNLHGKNPEVLDYLIRWSFRLVDIWFTLGSLASMLIVSGDFAQRLGGRLSNTTLVRLSPKKNLVLDQLLEIDRIQNYEPRFPQVRQLNESEMLTLKSALERYKKYKNPDTVLIEDAKKTFPGTSDPREIFKWPVKFRADGVNNAKRANPNIRYEWKVRCECGHDGAGPESPWSDVKIFNVPNFDPTTGIYTPPPGAGEYTDGEVVVVKSLNTLTLGEKLTLPANMKNNNTGKLLLKKRKPRKASKSISQSAAVKLYPNPANDVLNIVLDGEATYVRIVDMAGRIIHQESGNGNMLRMDISDLSEGMYTVVLEVNGAISHSPFVVKK